MEVLLKAVFSMDPFQGCITRPNELSVVSTVQCSVVEIVRWSEVSWLVSDLVENSAVGSQFFIIFYC
jgi:hypothetical protein